MGRKVGRKKGVSLGQNKAVAPEIDTMLPIMALMLILIPMLVGNIAFFHLNSIEVSTPGVSNEPDMPLPPPPKADKDRVVMLQLHVSKSTYLLELIDEDSGEPIFALNMAPGKKSLVKLQKTVAKTRQQFPKLDTVLITVEDDVPYEGMVHVLRNTAPPIDPKPVRKLASPDQNGDEELDNPEKPKDNSLKLVLIPKGGV